MYDLNEISIYNQRILSVIDTLVSHVTFQYHQFYLIAYCMLQTLVTDIRIE